MNRRLSIFICIIILTLTVISVKSNGIDDSSPMINRLSNSNQMKSTTNIDSNGDRELENWNITLNSIFSVIPETMLSSINYKNNPYGSSALDRISHVDISSKGLIATIDENKIVILNLNLTSLYNITLFSGATALKFSHTGEFLVYTTNFNLFVVRLDHYGFEIQLNIDLSAYSMIETRTTIEWSYDDRFVAVGLPYALIGLDITEGVWGFIDNESFVHSISFHPKKNLLVYAYRSSVLKIIEFSDNFSNLISVFQYSNANNGLNYFITGCDWTANGDSIIIGTRDGYIHSLVFNHIEETITLVSSSSLSLDINQYDETWNFIYHHPINNFAYIVTHYDDKIRGEFTKSIVTIWRTDNLSDKVEFYNGSRIFSNVVWDPSGEYMGIFRDRPNDYSSYDELQIFRNKAILDWDEDRYFTPSEFLNFEIHGASVPIFTWDNDDDLNPLTAPSNVGNYQLSSLLTYLHILPFDLTQTVSLQISVDYEVIVYTGPTEKPHTNVQIYGKNGIAEMIRVEACALSDITYPSVNIIVHIEKQVGQNGFELFADSKILIEDTQRCISYEDYDIIDGEIYTYRIMFESVLGNSPYSELKLDTSNDSLMENISHYLGNIDFARLDYYGSLQIIQIENVPQKVGGSFPEDIYFEIVLYVKGDLQVNRVSTTDVTLESKAGAIYNLVESSPVTYNKEYWNFPFEGKYETTQEMLDQSSSQQVVFKDELLFYIQLEDGLEYSQHLEVAIQIKFSNTSNNLPVDLKLNTITIIYSIMILRYLNTKKSQKYGTL